MLPDGLIWIMDKLGFEWPDLDEDEMRRGADLLRAYGGDLEDVIQRTDRKINGELAASLQGEAGLAYVNAWNVNRSQNLQRLVDVIDPAATGVDIAAGVVTALKTKVIIDVTSTAFTVAAMLTNPFTAPGAVAVILAKKALLNIAMDMAMEEAMSQVLPLVIEPLAEQVPAIAMAVLDSPLVEATGADPGRFMADLQALDQVSAEMESNAVDIEDRTEQLIADLLSLNVTGG
ncbi:hypothetical protein ACJ5H2_00520 [Nocardioides sp. R1-1]|uniref:WXG100-like domain-containing protein n=1 Tax=Nocardioides sp. R1-1 TaxID=3383502 RepID=UPI0038D21783